MDKFPLLLLVCGCAYEIQIVAEPHNAWDRAGFPLQ